ncbi:hypothetical protein [Streptomyces sp. NPDC093094]|uniref:hypothetical protein n=1 Tax=Streptomyces sp. NPDC093094 TaxID=3366026 RepID=UPI003818B3B3
MDGHETAHLEWWANTATCLARVQVEVRAAAGAGEWEAVISPPLDHNALEELSRLIEADPYLTLRFASAAVEVQAERVQGLDRLQLTVIAGL